MILMIWACMLVFYIAFFSMLGMMGICSLVGSLARRRGMRSRFPRGARPAYS